MADAASGRCLVYRFLNSLYCYNSKAALSISSVILDDSISDIYYELVKDGYTEPLLCNDMEDFFIDQFYCDFMWIEVSDELIKNWWFSDFWQKMVSLKLDKHIPILIISYGN